MFPPEFDYRRPGSLDEALTALAADDAVPLAGGHSLVPDLKARRRAPGTLVDLSALDDLSGVEATDERLVVGALTVYADLLAADPAGVDVLTEATEAVGDRQIRNCGTVGGNLAAADPRGDLPAAALAADATLAIRSRDGERRVPADEFFRGDGETACSGDELLTEVRIPTRASATSATADGAPDGATVGGAYAKKTHPAEGYAAVGVAARVEVAAGEVADARVAVNGLFDRARRLDSVEDAAVGLDAEAAANDDENPVADAVTGAADGVDPDAVSSDHLVSGAYRLRLLPAYAERALSRAIDRATGTPPEGVVA